MQRTIDNASILSVTCINYYLDDMLPVLTDSFMNPVYPKPVYKMIKTECLQSIQQTLNDPWLLLMYNIRQSMLKGHPYEAECDPTPQSVENITIDAMKKWHKNIMDSRRLVVVIVSQKKAEELIEKLDSSLGTIKTQTKELPQIKTNEISVYAEPVIQTHASATDSGYAARIFKAPTIVDDDYIAASLAAGIYSTTLHNVVRTKYGACYGSSAAVTPTAGCGLEYCYMLSNLTDYAKYIKQARDIMHEGKYIEKMNEDGSFVFSKIEDVLEGAKNSMINEIYASTTNTSGRAYLYIDALVNYNDITAYDSMIDKIHSVTIQEVKQAFEKYWIEQPSQWFAVVGPESENVISFEE